MSEKEVSKVKTLKDNEVYDIKDSSAQLSIESLQNSKQDIIKETKEAIADLPEDTDTVVAGKISSSLFYYTFLNVFNYIKNKISSSDISLKNLFGNGKLSFNSRTKESDGNYSSNFGYKNTATGEYQSVRGKYSKETEAIDVVGYGTDEKPKNIYELDSEGNLTITGNIYCNDAFCNEKELATVESLDVLEAKEEKDISDINTDITDNIKPDIETLKTNLSIAEKIISSHGNTLLNHSKSLETLSDKDIDLQADIDAIEKVVGDVTTSREETLIEQTNKIEDWITNSTDGINKKISDIDDKLNNTTTGLSPRLSTAETNISTITDWKNGLFELIELTDASEVSTYPIKKDVIYFITATENKSFTIVRTSDITNQRVTIINASDISQTIKYYEKSQSSADAELETYNLPANSVKVIYGYSDYFITGLYDAVWN